MSVLIKDMEMPKKCGECDIYVCYRTWHGDPGDEFCGLTKKCVHYKTKPEWCPLSEVPERKTGKWIKVHGYCTPGGDPVWACSECGKGIHVYGIEHGTYGADIADDQWKACPNCGADMRGDEDG